jgi:acetyl/propionyl-CoA carboxylase alpha subunit
MNTRLQVEHPVTEEVIGRDLVADQLRIAGGATLASLGLERSPAIRGHAIEARLYAEDPESGFLPATGRLELVRWPAAVRVDTGIQEGDEVTDRYDPMLAKLVVHAPTRAQALDRLRSALAGTTILGVRTNVRFLRWLAERPEMGQGEMRTDTIARLELPGPPDIDDEHWRAAAARLSEPSSDPWSGGWRLNADRVLRLRHGSEERSVPPVADVAGPAAVAGAGAIHVDVGGQSLEFREANAPTVEDAVRHAASAEGAGGAVLTAPMPGRVLAVRATAGGHVHAGEPVVIIEAMKMEHAVVAPMDGTVVRVEVGEGDQVERGAPVAEISAAILDAQ